MYRYKKHFPNKKAPLFIMLSIWRINFKYVYKSYPSPSTNSVQLKDKTMEDWSWNKTFNRPMSAIIESIIRCYCPVTDVATACIAL